MTRPGSRAARAASGKTTVQLFKATRELLDTLMRESGFTHYPDVDALVWELASKEHARRDAARSRVHASADGRNAPSLEQ